MSKITRREFIKIGGLTAGAAFLAACQPQVVEKVVKETVVAPAEKVVETKIVEKEKVVEKEKIVEVTATPLPKIVTPQGRELPEDAAPLDKQVWPDFAAEPKFLDAARDVYYAQFALNFLTEPLLRNNENFEVVPAAMEAWKPGPKAEYWEFTIRKDNKWSDGTPMTADDVVYTYKHLANPALANSWIWFYFDIKGVQAYATGKGSADDIGVKKIDDRTVQIYGQYGSIPYLPALVSYQASVIVPKHVAESNPEHWADNAEGYVCAGPYICKSWEHNKSAVLEASPTYNGPHKPGIQKINLTIYTGTFDTFNAFLNKETYLFSGLTLAQLATVRADTKKLNPLLHSFNNFQSEYIALNTNMEPTNNKALRQALAHAIDRETMCFQVMNGTYLPGYSMLPPNFPGYNPELKEFQKFDVELAKSKLAESGLDPAKIKIELYANARDARMEFIKQQWETNLGIAVDLIQVEGSVWGDKRGKHEMMAYKGPYEYDFLDPSNMLTGLWRSIPAPEGKTEPWGSPRHAWKNEEFDKLVTDAGSETDVEKRIKMFQDAEKILCEDVGGAFITHQVIFQVWYPWVVGMHPDKSGNVVYRYLDIARFQMYIHKDVDELMKQY